MAEMVHFDGQMLLSSAHVARASWTAIIHVVGPEATEAASLPKLLAWCAERLEPFCHHRILVVPQGSISLARPALEKLMDGPFKLITQREPLGVGNALQLCQSAVKTPRVIVMQAGPIALTDETMQGCMTLSKQNPEVHLILPKLSTEEGDSDCGISFFRSAALFGGLTDAGASILRGFHGQDQTLQCIVPVIDKDPGRVIVVRIQKENLYARSEAL